MASLRSSIWSLIISNSSLKISEHLGRYFSFRLFVCCWEVHHHATINQFSYVWFGVTQLSMHHLLDDHCTRRGIVSTQGTIITCQSFPSTPINVLIRLIFLKLLTPIWRGYTVLSTGYWVLVTECWVLYTGTRYWVLGTEYWALSSGNFCCKKQS